MIQLEERERYLKVNKGARQEVEAVVLDWRKFVRVLIWSTIISSEMTAITGEGGDTMSWR